MKNRLIVWRAALAAVCILVAGGGLTGAKQAHGQIPGNIKPDVQVIVMPLPATGMWGVSTVYPKQLEKAEAETRLGRLLARGQWKAANIVFENGQIKRKDLGITNPDYLPTEPPPPVMSSLSFATTANMVDLTGGTMTLEPFAEAFRDLSRVHVTYLVPKGFVFHGLRHFENNDLSLDMMSGGEGAYTYVMNIKNHQLHNLTLPATEPLSPARASGDGANGAAWKQKRLLGGGLVVVIALLAGALVYLWAQKLGTTSKNGISKD